ncbi:MAG: HD domain-containing protein [Candidatus Niyogibacteria bacterium]|nr:HD domain-containing protein [Candidatus Niyogibacteria bacterium]
MAVEMALKDAGYEAYLVGGCVRDLLIGRKPKDWDITTNAKPEAIQKLFAEHFYENSFGTVSVITESLDPTLKVIEITPYRLEGKYSDLRHPDDIKFAEKLEDDLARRDFTVNALALDADSGAIVDLFGGAKDLEAKIIRAVGNAKERFSEDALRIMRAARLTIELGFKMEPATEKALVECAPLLKAIALERIRDEFAKIIVSPHPRAGMELLRELGIMQIIIPELLEGYGVTQNKEHAYAVWDHNLRALEHAADKGWGLDVRLGALLHDVGKPRTKRGEGYNSTFYGHDVVGAKMTEKILTRLKFPQKLVGKVTKLVRYHLFFSDTSVITLSAVRRVVRNVGAEDIHDLIYVRLCDRIGMGRPKERPFRLRKYEAMIDQVMRDPISVGMLKTDGNRLMELLQIAPGPKIGQILNILLEEVLDDPQLNMAEYLEKRATELNSLPDSELVALATEAKKKSGLLEEEEVKKIEKKHFVG